MTCAGVVGCRQRAYTELYVEKMAGEVRMLEDRVYEYDAAYQALEQEIEDLRRTNARLESQYRQSKSDQTRGGTSGGSSDSPRRSPPLKLKDPVEVIPSPSESAKDTNEEELQPPSVLIPNSGADQMDEPPAVLRAPVAPPTLKDSTIQPKTEELLPPVLESKPPAVESPQSSNKMPKRTRAVSSPSSDNLVEQYSLPASMERSESSSALLVAPPQGTKPFLSTPSQPSSVPSLLKLPKPSDQNSQGLLERGRIKLPEGSRVQLASATETRERAQVDSLIDQKVSEVGFHPTMCRGHNFDGKPGDDGLYIVITPLNSNGQVVNTLGKLTIVVEDSALSENNGRVAAWEYSPEELDEVLEPIGASQGFHLSLPWQDTLPLSQTVTVFIRYQLEDGRTPVNRCEVRLRKPSSGQSVWTPR